jgi:thiol-disulfide isomerase/thioredoxin
MVSGANFFSFTTPTNSLRKKVNLRSKNFRFLSLLKTLYFIKPYNFKNLEPFWFYGIEIAYCFSVVRKKLLFLIATLFLLSLPAYGEDSSLFSKIGIQSIGDKKKTPDFRLEGLNGEKVQLIAFKGKIIFLNFWATWCGPCKEEMPSMEALYQHYKERNFAFLTISLDYGGPELVRKFIEKHRYHFPVLPR